MIPASKRTAGRLLDSTFEISRIMRQQMLRDLGDQKMNFQQIHALFIIDERNGMTMKEFASALHVTSPSATTFVDRLVRQGWVERKADPANRKLVRLSVSRSGKNYLRTIHRKRNTMMADFLSLLSPHEQTLLADLHEKLITRFQQLSSLTR
jgi:DNA-binding MarR family transcriptional regulator